MNTALMRASIFVPALAAFFLASPVLAQTNAAPAQTVTAVYSTVTVTSPRIQMQTGNTFVISFALNNQTGVQPDIRYAVRLVDKNGTIIDQRVYDDSVTLGENASVIKTIPYAAPLSLSGTYDLLLSSKNRSGTPLGIAFLGSVTLHGAPVPSIVQSSCYLTSSEDATGHHYMMPEMLFVKDASTVRVTCTAKNGDSKSVTLMPTLVERIRSSFGDVVPAAIAPVTVSLSGGGTSAFTIALPKQSEAQVYYGELALKDASGVSTNSYFFRYTVEGAGASIRSLVLDRSSYRKGDTATVSFMWTPLADSASKGVASTSLPITSSTAVFSITNGEGGQACASDTPYALTSNDHVVKVPIPITADCASPKVTVALTNPSTGVLDKETFTAPATAKTITMNLASNPYMWMVLIGLVGIGLVSLLRGRKSMMPPTTPPVVPPVVPLAILFLAVGLLAPIQQVHAVGVAFWQICGPTQLCARASNIYATGSIDKSSYNPGDSITLYIEFGSDDYPQSSQLYGEGKLDTTGWSGNVVPGPWTRQDLTMGNVFGSYTFVGGAQTTPGSYNVTTRYGVGGYTASYPGPYLIPYTVTAPPPPPPPTVNLWFN